MKKLLLIGVLMAMGIPAFAQTNKPTEYILLQPLPYIVNKYDAQGNLTSEECKKDSQYCATASSYIAGLFRLLIAMGGLLAVIMIMYGGFQYMASASFSGTSNAKDIIQNAVWGLVLTIVAWVILNTINPELTNFNLSLTPIKIATPTPITTGGGGPLTPEQLNEDKNVRIQLSRSGIIINAGPCQQANQRSGCTNLNGLPTLATVALITLKNQCKCTIRITGGTETGPHATHGPGKPIVDLGDESSLRSWLISNKYLDPQGTKASVSLGGTNINFNYERRGQGNSTGNHWHVIIQ